MRSRKKKKKGGVAGDKNQGPLNSDKLEIEIKEKFPRDKSNATGLYTLLDCHKIIQEEKKARECSLGFHLSPVAGQRGLVRRQIWGKNYETRSRVIEIIGIDCMCDVGFTVMSLSYQCITLPPYASMLADIQIPDRS